MTHLSEHVEFVTSLAVKCKTQEEQIIYLETNYIPVSEFRGIPMTVKEVAKMRRVHEHTVRAHIKMKKLPLHPQSTESCLKVDLSDALKYNFK